MLMPRKVRHRKEQRGRMTGVAKGGTKVTFGDFGIQALEPGWITNRQIEAARIAMTRHIKRGGKVWINIFPDKPVTQKPAETRMGSGKGNPEHWVAVVKPGRIMFELSGVPEPDRPGRPCGSAIHKLPIKTRFVVRQEEVSLMATQGRRAARAQRRPSWRTGWARRRQELFNLRFQNATGQLDNNARLRRGAPRHRPHRDAAARARDRRPPRPRRSRHMAERPRRTEADARAQPPQGPRGHGRLHEDGQDGRRRRHRPGAAPPLRQDVQRTNAALRARRGQRRSARATGCASRRPARCRS